ncbi:MAG: macro domain-containing protein [Luteolibacter sp.]
MIHFTQGDILCDDSEAVVNPVNCVGVMGRGLALQFRKAYPDVFRWYAEACKRGEVQPGRMFVTETGGLLPRYVVNFPTKRHWQEKSRMEDIEDGLDALVEWTKERKIRSISIPPLGAGLGGLDWKQVRQRIIAKMENLDGVNVTIYKPTEEPKNPMPSAEAVRPTQ